MIAQDVGTETQIGLVAAVWRYRVLTFGLAIVGALLASVVTLTANSNASAKASVALTDPRGNSVFRQGSAANIDLTRYTAERAVFAESEQVLTRAAKALGGDASPESVNAAVTVTPSADTSILDIVAESASPAQAVKVADAVATAYQDLALDETKAKAALALSGLEAQRQQAQTVLQTSTSTPAEVSSATQTLSAVNAKAADIQSAAELFGNGVSFFDPARPVKKSGLTTLLRNAVAGGLIGLVIGSAISWVLADRRQKRPHDSEDDSPGGWSTRDTPPVEESEPIPMGPGYFGTPAEPQAAGERTMSSRAPENLL